MIKVGFFDPILGKKYELFRILFNRAVNYMQQLSVLRDCRLFVLDEPAVYRRDICIAVEFPNLIPVVSQVFNAHGFEVILNPNNSMVVRLEYNGTTSFRVDQVTCPYLKEFIENVLTIYEQTHGYSVPEGTSLADRYCEYRKVARIRPVDNPVISQSTLVKLLPIIDN